MLGLEPKKFSPLVMLCQGEAIRAGWFDQFGDLIPNYGFTPSLNLSFGAIDRYYYINFNPRNQPAYEHRSGRLIKGHIACADIRRGTGVFVPEIGSTIGDLADYVTGLDKPQIYNLPHTWRIAGPEIDPLTGKIKFKTPKLWPAPPKTGVPPGWEFGLTSDWLKEINQKLPPFKREELPWYAHVRGNVMELGHLDDYGDFVPARHLRPFPLTMPLKNSAPPYGAGEPQPIYYNLPRGGDSEEVFEYRSGRLISGTLLKSGRFVPIKGTRVIDLKDYGPIAGTIWLRIYNLPGALRQKGERGRYFPPWPAPPPKP